MRAIKLTFLLDRALGDGLDAFAIGEAAQKAAQGICDRLGLPAAPSLTLERAALTHGLAALYVEGAPCRHADSLESQLFAAERGLPYVPSPRDTIAAWLRQHPERMPPFFGAFVQHALSAQADRLLTEPVLAAYRDRLPETLASYPLEALRKLLAPLLALRLCVGRAEVIAEVLQNSADEPSEALLATLRPQQLAIACSEVTLRNLTVSAQANEHELFTVMRDGLFYELGIRLPSLTFAIDDSLPLNQFSLALNDLPSVPWQGLNAEQVLVHAGAEQLRERGIPAEPAYNIASGRRAALAHRADADAIRAEGFHVWTPFGHLVLNVSALLRQHSALLVCQAVAQRMLEQIGLAFPALGQAVQGRITPAALARLLRALLTEGVGVRNVRLILEAILAYDYILVPSDYLAFDERLQVSAPPPLEAGLLAFTRMRLSRQLTQQAARDQTPIPAYLLAPELEAAILGAPERAQARLLSALRAHTAEGVPILLTSADVRAAARALIGVELPQVRVLAYQELVPEVAVQPIARLTLDES
ncbi:MAG: FHIPEP family type III secretion protein [Aggregatilineales bacterium]